MNDYQLTLYNQLMALTNEFASFRFIDQQINNHTVRIFTYRLASYTEFCHPGALECRGHTFVIEGKEQDATPIALVCLPLPKFFNLNENPFTMGLDLSKVTIIEDKADGSLISSVLVNDNVLLKSKTSFTSDYAIAATELLQSYSDQYQAEVQSLTTMGYTINWEWVSPNNRIVLNYDRSELRTLAIRKLEDGSFVDRDDIKDDYPLLYQGWTARIDASDPIEYLNSIPNMTGIEGVVCHMPDGMRFKLKTAKYVVLHRLKEDINSPRRLAEAVLEEITDDIKSLFHDDPVAIEKIQQMENFIYQQHSWLVETSESFYQINKHMDRKEYAVLAKYILHPLCFVLVMILYSGKEIDMKEFLKKFWKQLWDEQQEKILSQYSE